MVAFSKYFSVYFFSIFKFIAGPTIGMASGLSITETAILTTAGMMTSVIALIYAGKPFREWISYRLKFDQNKDTPKRRQLKRVWKKYGIIGVAFLTPLILTPIGGTLLIIAFGGPPKKVITYMFISAALWSVVLTFGVRFVGNEMNLI